MKGASTSVGHDQVELDGMALLDVVDLSIHFSSKRGLVTAVDQLSFQVRHGETLALVGETGSGKSVTGRSLMQLLPVPPAIYASGHAYFHVSDEACRLCGGAGCPPCDHTGRRMEDLLGLDEEGIRSIRGNRIAMIFQEPGRALNPAYTIQRQLAESFTQHRSADLLGTLPAEDASRAIKQMASGKTSFVNRQLVRLPPWREEKTQLDSELSDRISTALAETEIANPRQVMSSYPHELSGGMQQRVMIAQALACNPDLLIADEPTTALDVTVQARILDLIAELQERRGTAVLYISHDLSLVRQISDRVAVMYGGRLAEIGDVESVFADPKHPYTRGLLAATPDGTQERGRLRAIPGTVPEFLGLDRSCRFNSRCPFAAPVCVSSTPELLAVDNSHRVSCFLHDDADRLEVEPSAMPVGSVG